MKDSRTYIAVRLWEGYALELDCSPFNEVSDTDLPELLSQLAARFFREFYATYKEEPLLTWARKTPEPSPALVPQWDWEQRLVLLNGFMRNTFETSPPFRAPRWISFHVEPTLSRAVDVVGVLNRIALSFPVQLRLTGQHELARPAWLLLERDIEQFDELHRWNHTRNVLRDRWEAHPLKRLQVEARAISRLLDSVSPPPVATPTSSLPIDPAGPSVPQPDRDLAETKAEVNKLPKAQQRAYREFLEACAAEPELDQARVTDAHFQVLESLGRELPTKGAWRKSASEALRKLYGPAKLRRIDPTRSMVKRSDFDRVDSVDD